MADFGIVVPVFNGERYIAACLDSIVAQGTDRLKCLVMDGGSTDETVAIAKAYGPPVEVVSERDEGQADAIAKGFAALDTPLIGWLNADDTFLPGALERISEARLHDREAVLFHGAVEFVDARARIFDVSEIGDLDRDRLRRGAARLLQPGSFYDRAAVARCGGVDKSFHLLMDVDLWIRLLAEGPACFVPHRLAQFRVHADAKSSQVPWRYYRETLRIASRHQSDQPVVAALMRSRQIALHFVKTALGLHRARGGDRLWTRDGVFITKEAQRLVGDGSLGGLERRRVGASSHAGTIVFSVARDLPLLARPKLGAQLVAIVDEPAVLPPRRDDVLYRRCAFFMHAGPEGVAALQERAVPSFRQGSLEDPEAWARAASLLAGSTQGQS